MLTLIPILGDQLSLDLASLRDADPATTRLLMMEVIEEATYVRHHKTKLAFIFAAMRHHADALRAKGWQVDYHRLDDPDGPDNFTEAVGRAVGAYAPNRIIVTEAGEWRVQAMLETWETLFGLSVEIRADDRFLCSHAEFDAWAEGRRELRMEFFYREMRRKTGFLMDGDTPAGGRWNFDKQNRRPARPDLFIPKPRRFKPDAVTRDVIAMVADRFADHPGRLEPFDLPVTRAQAMRARREFLDQRLADFGPFQDAMLTGEPLLYHALLSPMINIGLLDPIDLCRQVDALWRDGKLPLASAEGFIRQIIGWREYMRGIYWREGPDYAQRNALGASRPLPAFYWTAETDMNCLRQAIGQTLDLAYAHHIQRLMVTGNFAMLMGADPHAVHLWYLEIYTDAYEWVELPNTLGMSQFGDGGLVASKPYAASGAYINRMSDYCGACRYDPKQRIGDDACPFNALYWDFLARNRKKLGANPRLAMPYRNWDRMADQPAVRAQARRFLAALDAEATQG